MKEFIKKILNEQTEQLSLPLVIKGRYTAPKGDADALHSFERRKSDKFGGRMTSKIDSYLKKVYETLNVNPDVKDLTINVDSKSYSVEWSATIDVSKDGKAYMGVTTRGSAGGTADRRAEDQIPGLMSNISKNGGQDATLLLDFKNPSGVYIRQFFYKYTIPSKFPPLSGRLTNRKEMVIDTGGPENAPEGGSSGVVVDTTKQEEEFKTWESGEYEIKDDETWIYRLNDDKQWETKKRSGGDYKLMKDALDSGSFSQALTILKTAKKVSKENYNKRDIIKSILREEIDKNSMDERVLNYLKRHFKLEEKNLSLGDDEKPIIVKTLSFNVDGDWYSLNSFMSKKEMTLRIFQMLADNDIISFDYYEGELNTEKQKVVRTIRYFLDNIILKKD